jgi:hypothetical protein
MVFLIPDPLEDPRPEPFLFAARGESLRFVPGSAAFLRRTWLVNGLLGSWPIVFGSGSWLEAHLVARLALAPRLPNLRGCGISEQEVWDLVQQELEEGNRGAPLVVLCDSLTHDQGRGLMRRLRCLPQAPTIIAVVQNDHWLNSANLVYCQAQSMFSSFAAANPGGLAQMVNLGSGEAGRGMVLGIEDIPVGLPQSDRDFNDLLLKVTGVSVPIF